jgi:hypothetical protein
MILGNQLLLSLEKSDTEKITDKVTEQDDLFGVVYIVLKVQIYLLSDRLSILATL